MRAKLVEAKIHQYTHLKPKTEDEMGKAYEQVYKFSYKRAKKIAKALNLKDNRDSYFGGLYMVPEVVKMINKWYIITEVDGNVEDGYFDPLVTIKDKMKYFARDYHRFNISNAALPKFQRAMHDWSTRESFFPTTYHRGPTDEELYGKFKKQLDELYMKITSIER